MSTNITQMNCPACGAPIEICAKECEFCHGPVMISTFHSVYEMPIPSLNKYVAAYKKGLTSSPDTPELNNSIAMCYLKLKLYTKAAQSFEAAIAGNIDNSETYFYAAVSLLNGKKAFLANRDTIDKIEEYINAALLIEPRGIYYLFFAYIRYDYHFRKRFKVTPSYAELLSEANQNGYSQADSDLLFSILSVDKPQDF